MARKPVVAVVGTGEELRPTIDHARQLGELIARECWVVLCGGRDAGVMRAVSEGARAGGGMTIGILPSRSSSVASGVDVAIFTDLGNARNNVIVLSANVVVACGIQGPGTASEVALALKNKVPVVLLGVEGPARQFVEGLGAERVYHAATPEEAIALIKAHKLC